ncbi:MAG: ABC transporter ATP-binding protein [Bacteroidota bacterium]|nr:ABC transporter ATP-binding protein [Bacteroidota bacterium]
MSVTPQSEIQSFFEHGDTSLAVRRLLDLTLDTADQQLMREAIKISKAYHVLPEQGVEKLSDENVAQQAQALLNKIATHAHSAKPGQVLVSAKDISKKYSKGSFSLKPTSIDIESGKIVGVVGQNGNGKTTLLRCIAGQLAIDNGAIDYSLLEKPDHYDIKNHIVFIPQRIPRWFGMLKDNLHFSAAISGNTGEWNNLLVDFMLERFQLSNYAHLTWDRISSGYRTRFEIARILLQQPSVLILDEPLANLDINAQQTLLTDLRFLTKSAFNPIGAILTSQQLHEVEKVADNVLLIKDGVCVFRTDETMPLSSEIFFEIETTAQREEIINALRQFDPQVKFNGGFYTISSMHGDMNAMLGELLKSGIRVSYFRDISKSTKRFF